MTPASPRRSWASSLSGEESVAAREGPQQWLPGWVNVSIKVRKEPGLVEELGGREAHELGVHLGRRRVGDGQEQRHGHVLADDRGRLTS